ncbi:MAG: DsbA family oxidoreductase [Gallionella sp.]
MQIEIWSDVICPWCFIGKRHFEKALEQFGHHEDISVIWRSFELDRDAPKHYPGTLEERLASKYGVSLQEAAAMNARVTAAAREAGLEYRLDHARPGNTFDAHRLLHFAKSKGLGDRGTECIMQAYFSESLPVADRAALAGLAPKFGMTEAEAKKILESDDYSDAVRADELRAAGFGVTGVPFFVFDGESGMSGAQPIAVFVEALQQTYR